MPTLEPNNKEVHANKDYHRTRICGPVSKSRPWPRLYPSLCASLIHLMLLIFGQCFAPWSHSQISRGLEQHALRFSTIISPHNNITNSAHLKHAHVSWSWLPVQRRARNPLWSRRSILQHPLRARINRDWAGSRLCMDTYIGMSQTRTYTLSWVRKYVCS